MCGIAGVFSLNGEPLPRLDHRKILDTLRHRGPDDEGLFLDQGVFLGARRLAIIDPEHGHQPVENEYGRFHLVMNGEIFDYDVLMDNLMDRGHHFDSRCDTEVAVHLFEDYWDQALDSIDGQFALAVHDRHDNRLLLARDRMGICPLYYAVTGDLLLFASEIKALLATGLIDARINPRSLDSVLAFGCIPSPGSIFEGIKSLPPGRFLEARDGRLTETSYWDIPYPQAGSHVERSTAAWEEEFRSLLMYASRRRLKADVPVGLYLSGGVDSASIASLVTDAGNVEGRVFAIGFPEPGFDETDRIKRNAETLNLDAQILHYPQEELARDLPRLVHYAETPLISTESVPLMALSGLASQYVKVVLTGEGADESLGGYRYFRWEAFRRRFGDSLLGRLPMFFMKQKFRRNLGPRNPFFPQEQDLRWAQEVFGFYPAGMMQMLYWRMLREMVYTDEMMNRQNTCNDADMLDLPRDRMQQWDQLNRSLYVSSRIFMSGHLLGPHGDRALMANSVEGRYPFLDRKVQEFLATVPPGLKTRWNREKYLLRRTMRRRLPKETVWNRKKPFLAPFGTPFIGDNAPDYVRELLSEKTLSDFGYFDPARVTAVVERLRMHSRRLETDRGESLRLNRNVLDRTLNGMALTFVLTTQLLEQQVRTGEFSA